MAANVITNTEDENTGRDTPLSTAIGDEDPFIIANSDYLYMVDLNWGAFRWDWANIRQVMESRFYGNQWSNLSSTARTTTPNLLEADPGATDWRKNIDKQGHGACWITPSKKNGKIFRWAQLRSNTTYCKIDYNSQYSIEQAWQETDNWYEVTDRNYNYVPHTINSGAPIAPDTSITGDEFSETWHNSTTYNDKVWLRREHTLLLPDSNYEFPPGSGTGAGAEQGQTFTLRSPNKRATMWVATTEDCETWFALYGRWHHHGGGGAIFLSDAAQLSNSELLNLGNKFDGINKSTGWSLEGFFEDFFGTELITSLTLAVFRRNKFLKVRTPNRLTKRNFNALGTAASSATSPSQEGY